jgi:hypothetical protein
LFGETMSLTGPIAATASVNSFVNATGDHTQT